MTCLKITCRAVGLQSFVQTDDCVSARDPCITVNTNTRKGQHKSHGGKNKLGLWLAELCCEKYNTSAQQIASEIMDSVILYFES